MSEKKYLRAVSRQLKCSSAKKKEILRQIQSDIAAAVERGSSIEDAVREFGKPADFAGEFNANMGDAEAAKGRREKRIRVAGTISAVFVILAALVYWAIPKSRSIEESGRFSEQAVAEQAKLVIQSLDDKDYETLQTYMSARMKKILTQDIIWTAKDALSKDFGAFQSWGKTYMAEVSQMGRHSAVMEIGVSYENVSVIYRLSFDEDMMLNGLYMR